MPFFLGHILCQSAKTDFNKKSGFLAKDYLSMKRNHLEVQNPMNKKIFQNSFLLQKIILYSCLFYLFHRIKKIPTWGIFIPGDFGTLWGPLSCCSSGFEDGTSFFIQIYSNALCFQMAPICSLKIWICTESIKGVIFICFYCYFKNFLASSEQSA